jgi:hypothetical protein
LTLITFGVLLKLNRETMARGVVLAVITMAFNPIYLRNNISLSLRLQNNDTKQNVTGLLSYS